MNYLKIYRDLIDRASRRALEEYSEKHHVIPRCLGGDNEPDNLVKLTPEEHFVAHQLLIKIYPENEKLIYALNLMSEKSNRRNNKRYGWIKRKCSVTRTGKTKEIDEGRKKTSEKLKGRTKETHEHVRLMTEKKIGKTKHNDEGRKKASEKLKGRTKHNDEGKRKTSEKLKGRTKYNDEGIRKTSEKLKGRTKETHEYLLIVGAKNAKILKGRTKRDFDYLKGISKKLRKLTNEQESYLVNARNNGSKYSEILVELKKQGVNIGYSALPKIYDRNINTI